MLFQQMTTHCIQGIYLRHHTRKSPDKLHSAKRGLHKTNVAEMAFDEREWQM